MAYGAARKSPTAYMTAKGFAVSARPGGHAAIGRYAALLPDPEPFRPFDRMRRNRNRCQYGPRSFSRSEVEGDVRRVQRMLDTVRELLDTAG